MEIHVKYIYIKGYKVALQIWDFGGEERFRFLLKNYARGSFGGIYMYDITRMMTTTSIEQWMTSFRSALLREVNEVPAIIVGGKIDLEEDRGVYKEEAERLKENYNFLELIECSSKTGENVELIFEILVKEILKIRGFLKNIEEK
jgi:small GTP-binding protein